MEDINQTLAELDKMTMGKIYQLFDADKITGPHHIYYAAANAYYAMENGSNISNRLDVETLLYASTQNQISKAIKLIGVSRFTKRVAVAVISETENDPIAALIAGALGELDDKALESSQEKYVALKELYEITDTAIGTLVGDKYAALNEPDNREEYLNRSSKISPRIPSEHSAWLPLVRSRHLSYPP